VQTIQRKETRRPVETTTPQFDFPFIKSRKIRVRFDEGPISTDGGAIFLRQMDARLGFLAALAAAIPDARDPNHIEHSTLELLRQRVFSIALGYEDCNDAKTLRHDPILKSCCDRDPIEGPDLASQPTLSRLETSADSKRCYLFGRQLLESYFVRHPKRPPRGITLDLDTSDDPTHGQQELSFFNAYYDEHCYLPLLIFDQQGDLLTAVLQPGKPQGAKPVVAILERIVARIREQWPNIRILIRGDSGFASPEMYWMCRRLKVNFVLGMGPNCRLKKLSEKLQRKAERKFLRTGEKVRLFTSAQYRARKGWPRSYRVLIKVEHSTLGANVRFVVTNLFGRPDSLYDLYVQRGEASENSIKDLKNALQADRLSCHQFWANQFRLFLHAAAYVLMYALRRLAHGTELAQAQMDTLRLRLLKIAVRVESTARRVWYHLTSSHPWQAIWCLIANRVLD